MQNRRKFTRVLFAINAKLTFDENQLAVKIHDISLNGALLSGDCKGLSLSKKTGILSFQLDDFGAKIIMKVVVAHQEDNDLGVQCLGIDIDSASLLRRLVELNLNVDEQLHKELFQLTRSKD
ncbi:MAG: PilZ domain-containing protein [Cognaticolwellia sp.]